ncbi:PIN domain-containing protein [Neptuniibacter sp. QD37_11]|uniref:PIN domain-containing protein n=1 Tax=Neptuniibacter sp. QD37_11 TaxID=3398209 RepID=UPI0039F4781C
MNTKKTYWAFVDLENITLKHVDLAAYERIIVFQGSQQKHIDFGLTRYDHPLNLTVIQMSRTGKNYLDSHLQFYLGKFHAEASLDVEFEVISHDSDFQGVIDHINHLGRVCRRGGRGECNTATERVCRKLFNRGTSHLPSTKPKLLNTLTSLTNSENGATPEGCLQHLINEELISIESGQLIYHSAKLAA